MTRPGEIVHACPAPGRAYTTCCLRMPTELPAADWYSTDPDRTTCTVRQPAEQDGGEIPSGRSEST